MKRHGVPQWLLQGDTTPLVNVHVTDFIQQIYLVNTTDTDNFLALQEKLEVTLFLESDNPQHTLLLRWQVDQG